MPRELHLGDFHPVLEARFVDALRATIPDGDGSSHLVVVPNRLLGIHLRRRSAALGVATGGLVPRALEDLIDDWAAPLARARGLRELPAWAVPALLAEIAPSSGPGEPGQPAPPRASEGTFRAMASTLRDLRDAGVGGSAIAATLKGKSRGGRRDAHDSAHADGSSAGQGPPGAGRVAEVARQLEAFERALERRRLVDDARRSLLACEALAADAEGSRHPAVTHLWIYGFYEWVGRQAAVVDALLRRFADTPCAVFLPWPGGRDSEVAEYARPIRRWFEARGFTPPHEPGDDEAPPAGDLERARQAFARRAWSRPAGPSPFDGDGSLLTHRAASASSEALDVLRIIESAALAREGPGAMALDPEPSVAILARQADTMEELAFAARRAGRAVHRLPAESLRRRPTGRALLALLDLAAERRNDAAGEGSLPRSGVEELIASGGLHPERFPGDSRPELWAQALRRRGLVGGLPAWNRFLERNGPQARLFETPEDDEERLPELSRELPAIAAFVGGLLEDLRQLGPEKKRWADRARRLESLIERWLAPGPDREALSVRIAELARLDHVVAPSERNVRLAIEEALDHGPAAELRFGDAPTLAALASLRGVTFDIVCLPRLVEKAFPRAAREDPFLSDDDRAWLAGRLSVSRGAGAQADEPLVLPMGRAFARAEEAFLFQLTLGMARRVAVLTWPLRGDDGGPLVPSSFLLDLARAALGREATYGDLRSSALPAAPEEWSGAAARPMLGSEWDLARLADVVRGDQPRGALGAWLAVHPRLRQASLADRARRRGEITGQPDHLTEFDGLVGADLVAAWWTRGGRATVEDSARRHSPSALEDYARCGFRYLWKRVLRTHGEPAPERTLDLEPREIGSLMHDVLRELYRGLSRERLLPLSHTALGPARQRLAPILDRLVASQPGRIGEGPVALWLARRRRILEDLEEFLEQEVVAGDKWRPLELEAAFGEPEALTIEVGGERLTVRGRIDRIDERPGAVRIVDYKTGRLGDDEQPGSIAGGQRLQLPLYRLALERSRGERRPLHGALLGITSKSDFRRVEWTPAHFDDAAGRLGEAIHGIVSGIDAGEFFQVERDRFCDAVCEWTSVCGPARRRVVAAKRDDPRVAAAEAWRGDRGGDRGGRGRGDAGGTGDTGGGP
jgi:RecB family exonuclease